MSCLSNCSPCGKAAVIGYAVFAVLSTITAIALVAITGGAVAAPAALALSAAAGAALCTAATVCYIAAPIILAIGIVGVIVMLCCKKRAPVTATQPEVTQPYVPGSILRGVILEVENQMNPSRAPNSRSIALSVVDHVIAAHEKARAAET